jgi:hypothetical protein
VKSVQEISDFIDENNINVTKEVIKESIEFLYKRGLIENKEEKIKQLNKIKL